MASLNKENLQRHLSRHSSKDEISESKQILFNKHLGEEVREEMNITRSDFDFMNTLESNSAIVHDTSDGCVSSNYPNSSFSTFRENTFNSFSSMTAAIQATTAQDDVITAENTECAETSLVYETGSGDCESDRKASNKESSVEKDPIRTEEEKEPLDEVDHKRPMKSWGQSNLSNVERKFMLQQKRMQEYFKHKDTDRWQASLSTETDMSSVCNPSDCPEEEKPMVEIVKPPTPKIRREKTPEKLVKSEIAKELEPKKLVIPMQEVLKRPVPRPVTAPIFKRPSFVRDKESVASSVQSHVSGVYTNEYLTRARKFGAVVGALRKPGHHIGPAKNPDCICEHCTRWFEEKCKGRGRANSITNAPLTFEGFRVRRLQQ